jgi:protein SCO1/2
MMRHQVQSTWRSALLGLVAVAVAAALVRTAPAMAAQLAIGGPFELVDTSGREVTDQTFRGKWMLVYFGYTSCPDACPTTLSEISLALDALGPLAPKVQPIFITIDPERDTPTALADYVKTFDPRIVALTGSTEQIAAAAKAYRVSYAKVATSDGGNYLMDHSSIVYLMDPEGRLATFFPPDTTSERIVDTLRQLLAGS